GGAVGAAQFGFERTVRVRHHPQHIAALVLQAGDVGDRAVGVVGVAEDDLALALDAFQRLFVGVVVPVGVALGHYDFALALIARGEAGLAVGDGDAARLADVFQAAVAHQGARQHPGFAQDLEAVADADHGDAVVGGLLDRLHDRGLSRHRAAAQIVAVGEPARQHDQVEALGQFGLGVPDHLDLFASGTFDGDLAVAIAVGTGENNDGCAHGRAS